MNGKWLVVGLTLWMLGCATNQAVKNEGLDSPTDAPRATEQVQKSEQNIKCPKNAKLINGKCLMQVESND